MNDSRLSVRLSGAAKSKLRSLSNAKGMSASELARILITHVLAQREFDLPAGETNEPDASRVRLELRLTESEMRGVAQVAAENGMSANRWIVSVVRSYLTHKPQFGMDELATIAESTRALAAIGRNLNQVAHALNRGQRSNDLGPVMEELPARIEAHVKSVSALIQANVNRWRIAWH